MLKAIFFLATVIFVISIAASTPHSAVASSGVKGDWDVAFTIAGQTVDGKISFDLKDKTLTGTVFSEHTGTGTVIDGSFENNKLSCTLKFEKHESIALSGELKDDKLSGTFATEGMTGTWSGIRKK